MIKPFKVVSLGLVTALSTIATPVDQVGTFSKLSSKPSGQVSSNCPADAGGERMSVDGRIAGAGLTPFMQIKAAESFLSTNPPHVKSIMAICWWRDIEPVEGTFSFHELFDGLIAQAHEKNVKILTMIWGGPQGPQWLYENGVPLVKSSKKPDWNYPYYFSEEYRFFFRRMINRYAEFIKSLPPVDLNLFVAHQICEGSTGDTSPYGSHPIDNEAYAIDRDKEWRAFRREVWGWYRDAFWVGDSPLLPFVFTDDANMEVDREWQIENLPVFGAKKGMFGHGYNNNDNGERQRVWRNFIERTERHGGVIFARGEYDNILLRAKWVQDYSVPSFYWSMLMALHSHLDYWNPATVLFENPAMYPAMEFYNRYAGWRNPGQAPAAFSALRKELNANNTKEFPEEVFGKSSRNNTARYLAIQAAFAGKGARLDDPSVMTKHGISTRRRKGKNDVGWDFTPGNFEMFLHQIDPDQTSTGWWSVGDEQIPYGRFARATELAVNKDKLYFRLNENFFEYSKTGHPVTVKVIWFDEGGSWSLLYKQAGLEGERLAETVTGTASNTWREMEIFISDGEFSGALELGGDLIIRYDQGLDTKFHRIEVLRE